VFRNGITLQRFKKNLTKKTTGWREKFLLSPWPHLLILFVLSAAIAVLLSPVPMVGTTTYNLGDVAKSNIKATQPLLIEDNEATEEKRRAAAEAVLSVYDYDAQLAQKISDKLLKGFQAMRKAYQNMDSSISPPAFHPAPYPYKAPPSPQADVGMAEKAKRELEQIWGIELSDTAFEVLSKANFSEDFETLILELLNIVMSKEVILGKQLLTADRNKGIVVRSVQTGQDIKVMDVDSCLSISEAQGVIRSTAINFIKQYKYPSLQVATNIAQQLVQPNLTFNRLETERRKRQAYNSQNPVFYKIEKGEMIVREGGRITPKILAELSKMKLTEQKRNAWLIIAGMGLLLGLFFLVSSLCSKFSIAPAGYALKDSLFLGSVMLLTFLLTLPSLYLNQNLSAGSIDIPVKSIFYSIPVSIGSMLVSIFLGLPIALIFSIAASFIAALMLGNDINFFAFFLLGSFVAARYVQDCRDRARLIKAGLVVGLINIITVLAINMTMERLPSAVSIFDVSFALMGAVLSGIIVTGLLPLVESVFGYTTNIKLLELANLDSPVLRDLLLRAPGTYHHCMIVGSMVEAAAAAIGANPLLSKVSAYYHDIGKTRKPEYFIENQQGGVNKHEKLAPSMSALILISHVKDGVEMAKRHGLGPAIVNIIKQHHGTSVISYFYQKALEAYDNDQSVVKEEDYRYPGPKPQTKEAGLVLLADMVEAAARTLQDPTPARVQGTVQKIINKVFSDGQLDNCELTLRDLHQIAKSFNKILNGIFHQRIEYPDFSAKGGLVRKGRNGNSYRKPAANGKDQSKADQEQNQKDLKRLGL
jgi:putative nucleotidyltransferase with HDIG domain